jgi:hypothetical protein
MRVSGSFGQYLIEDEPFATGGRAELFRCSQPAGHVYKRYFRPIADVAEITQLQRILRIGREVLVDRGDAVGSTPEASVNWPIDVVMTTQGTPGTVVGVVLPEIPARFSGTGGSPRTLDFLVFARANPPDALVRVQVLIRLAEIFAWLDAKALVHGDLSEKNVVWCGPPQPGAYLIDTDGLQPQDPPPRQGVRTDRWTDPRLIEGTIVAHDHHSDRYALALAMYRGLFLNPGNLDRRPDGTWPAPAALPKGLDPALRRLFLRTLTNPLNVQQRATPSDWVRALVDCFISGDAFDSRQLAVLDRHAQARRDDVTRAATATATFVRLPVHRVQPPTPSPVPPRPAGQVPASPRVYSPAPGSGSPVSVRQPTGRRRRTGRTLLVLVALIAVAAFAFVNAHGSQPPGSGVAGVATRPADPTDSGPSTRGPAPSSSQPSGRAKATAVLLAYYRAINSTDYSKAYGLLGASFHRRQSFSDFASGFADTEHDTIRIQSVEPAALGRFDVAIRLDAEQTDGSVKRFTGVYVIGKERGTLKIVSARVRAA